MLNFTDSEYGVWNDKEAAGMLWRKLSQVFYRKSMILTILLVMLWSIAGMFLQYQLYSMEASRLKWAPLEKMGSGWYYYMSYVPRDKEDLKKQTIHEKCHVLDMRMVRTSGGDNMDVYQYSGEAWEQFAYPLSDGDPFSLNPNEVIVSPGLKKEFPVGSKIRLTCNPKIKMKFSSEETEFICTVVGVLEQGEIFFRYWENEREAKIQGMGSAMFSGSQFQRTILDRKQRFAVVNPKLNIGLNSSEETAGVFFQAKPDVMSEIDMQYQDEGEIVSVSQVLEEFNGYRYGLGPLHIGRCIMLWGAAVLYTLCWQGYLLKKNVEELSYLMYIKYDKDSIWKRFLRVPYSRYALAGLISCLAYFLPNEYEGFWNMHWYIPAVTSGFYVVMGGLSRCFSHLYLKNKYLICTQEYLGERELLNYLCIQDLSVKDNLLFIFLAQNYPERVAARMAEGFLAERDIFYQNRRMSSLDMQKKMDFYQMRDELV